MVEGGGGDYHFNFLEAVAHTVIASLFHSWGAHACQLDWIGGRCVAISKNIIDKTDVTSISSWLLG